MSNILIAKVNGQLEVVTLIKRHSDRLVVRAIGSKTNRNIYLNDENVKEVNDVEHGTTWIMQRRKELGKK